MSKQPGSAYSLDKREEKSETHTMSVLVDNEPGVLARVIGLFAGRGYNIESLTVAEVDRAQALSRITVVTSGTRMIVEQIKAQLGRLVPVHRVHDLTDEGPCVERELALKIDPGNSFVKSNYKNCQENIQPPQKDAAAVKNEKK